MATCPRVLALIIVGLATTACGDGDDSQPDGTVEVATHRLPMDGDSPTAEVSGTLSGAAACVELTADPANDGPSLLWPPGTTIETATGTVSADDGSTIAVLGETVTLSGGEYSAYAAQEFAAGELPRGCGNGTYFLVFGSDRSGN